MPERTGHDVLIIGSGAGGGMAAWALTRLGVKCLMLEAGPVVDWEADRKLVSAYDLPFRGLGKPGRFPHVTQAGEFDANMWADEQQNPYTYPKDDPYYWVRIRALGGKTLRWGRASWRLSDYEFKCKDHDGEGDNWPVSYRDLAPFYDRVEPILRVSGRNEGWGQMPDGKLLADDSRDSESIARFREAAGKLGVPTTKPRRATGTLAASTNLLLPDAMATGKLTIVGNAVVRELSVDPNTGLVNGAHYVDRRSGQEFHVPAKRVIVSASTLESTRLLLNSRSPRHAAGLGNSSGVLGHYLFDQFYIKGVVSAVVPQARGGRASRTMMGGAGYIPRFVNVKAGDQGVAGKRDFLRGYAYDFGSGGTPGVAQLGMWGEPMWKALEDVRGAGFGMTTMGEVLPKRENHVRINPDVKDAWGIPVLHIQQRYGENEFKMAKHSEEMAVAMCKAAGFEVVASHAQMVPPGESIHELGTCRMGADAKRSVLNGWNQSHDVKNLFVVDGSAFVSGGAQNPTLTLMALALRASEYLAEGMKRGEL